MGWPRVPPQTGRLSRGAGTMHPRRTPARALAVAMVPVPEVAELVTLGWPCVFSVPLLLRLQPAIAPPQGVGAVYQMKDWSRAP